MTAAWTDAAHATISGISWGSFMLGTKGGKLIRRLKCLFYSHAEDDLVVTSVFGCDVAPERGKDVIGGTSLANNLLMYVVESF